jgi:hypothetical protein
MALTFVNGVYILARFHDHPLAFVCRRCDAPALGRKQLLGQDAEEHPSDSFGEFSHPTADQRECSLAAL